LNSDQSLILRAAQFARLAHKGQQRKYCGLSYAVHPARVAGRVAVHPLADDEMVAAAFLHDVVEDTPITLNEIKSEFGPCVARLVGELTKPGVISGATRSEKKAFEIAYLAGASREAKIIKLLDRIDNLLDIRDAPKDFAELYCQESRHLADAIGDSDLELKQELLECIDLVPDRY
jgi:(p)ppGpp synthase/HD superfamily hydrolase